MVLGKMIKKTLDLGAKGVHGFTIILMKLTAGDLQLNPG
jgi:hypothetical protein